MACHPNGGNAILPNYIIIGSDNLKDLHAFISLIRNPHLDNGQKDPCRTFRRRKSPRIKPGSCMNISAGLWDVAASRGIKGPERDCHRGSSQF